MILNCPFCQSRYLIAASLFAKGPRTVRCVRCSHQWTAEASDDVALQEMASAKDLTPIPETIPPIPEGSNLPALIKMPLPSWVKRAATLGSVLLGIVFLLFFIFNRQSFAKHWPFLEGLYDHIGLHIYHAGEGLKIQDVRSELRYEDGIMQLSVQGTVVNNTKKAQIIPPVMASAIGSDGDVMQSWQIDPPTATVDAKGTVPFTSTITSPKGTVVEINLVFVEEATHVPQ